ncbi:hypothetical protein ABZN20_04130 [Methylococcus sp. ANG]|uniref:hypothetical protein n=1 Tax=Methylococcus sp. ANG TaxID=3231903 RepID=UPI0034588F08
MWSRTGATSSLWQSSNCWCSPECWPAVPGFAFLDRPATALGDDQLDLVLNQLSRNSIGYVVFAETEDRMDRYDGMLELKRDGAWEWKPLAAP